ncbi:hypothetical protein BDDG_13588, partial [Blastomyces dermatitidis ATCC 18188]
KNFQIFRNRRLILKVSNQDILQRNKLNSNLIFRIRNEINQQFFSQLMTDIEVQKSVIASIESSFFRNFIILSTMSEFNLKCAFCARDHKTSEYKYEICLKRDEICQYTLLKCSNYKEKHASSSKEF